jgi:hypothetical protein
MTYAHNDNVCRIDTAIFRDYAGHVFTDSFHFFQWTTYMTLVNLKSELGWNINRGGNMGQNATVLASFLTSIQSQAQQGPVKSLGGSGAGKTTISLNWSTSGLLHALLGIITFDGMLQSHNATESHADKQVHWTHVEIHFFVVLVGVQKTILTQHIFHRSIVMMVIV